MGLEKNTQTNTQQDAELPGASPDCQRSQDLVPPEQRGEDLGIGNQPPCCLAEQRHK